MSNNLNPQSFQDPRNNMPIDENQLQNWNLPEQILRHYEQKGLIRLFDWQVECLQSPGVIDN